MLCGLYYKHVTIVNDNSSIISKWSCKLIDDPRVSIYDRNRFIIQATGWFTNMMTTRDSIDETKPPPILQVEEQMQYNSWCGINISWLPWKLGERRCSSAVDL